MVTGTRNDVETFLFRRGYGRGAAGRCPSCGEELSDRFAFCPVDGTPLGTASGQRPPVERGQNVQPRLGTGREDFRLTVIEHRALPVRLIAALAGAVRVRQSEGRSAGRAPGLCPDVQTAAESAARTGDRREEVRFAVMEDAGLLRRLAQELSAFAQESQLTWPEFRRDPAGFVRRAFDALDKLGLIPFSRRHKTTS